MPSPLLLDVSRLIWRTWRGQLPTGIDRACLAYVSHYRARAHAVVQRGGFTRILDDEASAALFSLLLEPPRDFRFRLVRLAMGQMVASDNHTGRQTDGLIYLNVGHTGLDRAGHRAWVRRTGVRALYYLHDLIPITHPQYAREGEAEKHAVRMETMLSCGAGIVANSRDSLAALADFAAQRGMALPPALCVPLGVEPFAITREPGPPPFEGPYFITVGTLEGRKNHKTLLAVWRRLVARMGKGSPKLVIVGQRGWAADDLFRMLDEDETLRPHVIELGRCGDSELLACLSHARALLFPSFVEGQGLPLTEALAMGTPVIASALDVFRETAGDIPDYLDPQDEEGWLRAVLDYSAADSPRRARQVERMVGFAPPDWPGHFLRVDAWLEEMAGSGR